MRKWQGKVMNKIGVHYGHNVVVSRYDNTKGVAVNYSVECNDCYETLFDEEVVGE
jgi:hypothetical protein